MVPRIVGKFSFLALLVVLAAALAACGAPTPAPTGVPQPLPADALVIRNGTVIVGTDAAPIVNGLVAIQGERIIAAGPAAAFQVPDTAQVIDARGGTILPGIINAHVHGTASSSVRRVYFLLKGVTSVCDMGSPLEQMPAFVEDNAAGAAARGFRCGPILSAPGGYPGVYWGRSYGYEVASPQEGRAAVDDLVARGADVIKISLEPGGPAEPWPMLGAPEAQAIVQEAHARNRLVRAHVGRTTDTAVMETLLLAGVDVMDHVPIPVFSILDAYELLKTTGGYTPTAVDDGQLAELAARGTVMVPTLEYVTSWCDSPQLTPQLQQACLDFYLGPVRRFHDLGGRVALGNDYGADDSIERGMPLRELQRLREAGLTPLEVIEAGTRNAAIACGHGQDLGTLEPGRLADVIVVAGDPLQEIAALTRLMAIVKGGQVVFTAP